MVINSKSRCNTKTRNYPTLEKRFGTAPTAKAGHYTVNRLVKNLVCMTTRINILVC